MSCAEDYESEEEPACIVPVEHLRIGSIVHGEASPERETSCNVPTPTIADTLKKIAMVYRSSSLADNPATQEWYDEVMKNASQIETNCRGKFLELELYTAQNGAGSALDIGQDDLPHLRKLISGVQAGLERAGNAEMDFKSVNFTIKDEFRKRDRLFLVEINALTSNSSSQFTLWHQLAIMRRRLLQEIVVKMDLASTLGRLTADETKVALVWNMALANEKLAHIQYIVSRVPEFMEAACVSLPDDFHKKRTYF